MSASKGAGRHEIQRIQARESEPVRSATHGAGEIELYCLSNFEYGIYISVVTQYGYVPKDKRVNEMTKVRRNQDEDPESDFPSRLQELIVEFGSRSALSRASGIAISTLQAYETHSKPGLEALLALARAGNVSLDWLLTGQGEKRPRGLSPGALLADVIMVDQYQPGTPFNIPHIVGRIPFSRHMLEKGLGLHKPSNETLLAIQATNKLAAIERDDNVLVDRTQCRLAEDGIYLLNLPSLVLKAVSVFPNGSVLVGGLATEPVGRGSPSRLPASLKMRRAELIGDSPHSASKVIGRAVWVGRRI